MTYKIEYNENILKSIQKIPLCERNALKRAIEERIAVDPVKFGKPLKGEWKGCYRLRVGDYRIIYEVKKSLVTVIIIKIGDRKDVYD